jgi:3-hydroxy-9,10-secoandrosta-1,3,5(10)-triene-9,17-dione monooxygenase reductase component
MATVTVDQFRAAMGSFAAGVTVVTTVDAHGTPFGLTATAFSSVSREPPLCLVCVSHAAEAYPVIVRTKHFAVNFLSADQEALSARFATHGLDKFDGVEYRPGAAAGCPLLDGTLGSVECRVQSAGDAGDHSVFVAVIEHVSVASGDPLVYFRGRYADLTQR